MSEQVRIKFWGVRGSIPAPLAAEDLERKCNNLLTLYRDRGCPDNVEEFLATNTPLTYGGNTSCVEIRYGEEIFVLDLGTGIRHFGNALFPELLKKGGAKIVFIVSHVHWDHIQGLPFFGPLYLNKQFGFKNLWSFCGGTSWQKTAEVCLRGQMDPPTFPVSWEEIKAVTYQMDFQDIYDGFWLKSLGDTTISFGKLNHPQETYGSRFSFGNGKIVAYTTDNEPYDPHVPDPRLLRLAKGADVWITDCQYTYGQYHGFKNEGGVPRHGWGHSYPEAVAAAAIKAEVKTVLLFHHDPASTDEKIEAIRDHTQSLIDAGGGGSKVIAAYEGLELVL